MKCKTKNKYIGSGKKEDCKKPKIWNPNTNRCVNDTPQNRKKGAKTAEKEELQNIVEDSEKIECGKKTKDGVNDRCTKNGKFRKDECLYKNGKCIKKTLKKSSTPPKEKSKTPSPPVLQNQESQEIIESSKYGKYYYPTYGNENFSNNIASRIEFQVFKENEESKDICMNNKFKLAPYQVFLKNFISRETPYKSILIYHGTGVGKTCSAVSIAENFKSIYKEKNKRIIILLPDAVKEGWRNNIHNPEADVNQCTGDEYAKEMLNLKKGYNLNRNLIKDRKKIVNYYYEFSGYRGFINNEVIKLRRELNNMYSKEEAEEKFKEKIKFKFSNKLLIIDEVHNIRNLGKGNKEDDIAAEKVFQGLEDIIMYSENLKLIMLSATPMYNEPTEIIKLLNLMLLNDNREKINKRNIFNELNEITREGEKIIKEKIRGYVSYVRGETPDKFPLRLYPVKKYNNGEFTYVDNVKSLDFLQLYTCNMNDYQKKVYEMAEPDILVDINLGEGTQLMEISNIVYPNIKIDKITNENYKKCYGKEGKNNYFELDKGKYKYKSGSEKIFRYDTIDKYSIKLYNLLKNIKTSEGIIFIYSRFIEDGAIPIMLALEQNGYNNFSGNNILIDRKDKQDYHHEFNKYIVVTGTKELSKNRDKELRTLLSEENKNGEKIKIIIGSAVASEGLDLKRIREIHVIDPWYHLNRLEQIIGRGVRYCSHSDLAEEKRNVSIYLYTSIKEECNNNIKNIKECSENVNNSIDIKIYEKAIEKSKNIGKIEKILKENAVDCGLFKNINNIKENKEIKIITSQNNEFNYIIKDEPYSKICSYQEECNYECNPKISLKFNKNTANNNLLKNIYPSIIKVIEKLLENEKIWYIVDDDNKNNIIKKIKEILNIENNEIIYLTLNYIINNKIEIICNDVKGEIIYINKHIIFQPKCMNINTPLYYKNKDCYKIERYKKCSIEEKQEIKNETDHYAEIISYENSDSGEILNSFERNKIIKSLKKNNYKDIKLYDLFGFNFYNKGKGKKVLKYQIMQPPLKEKIILKREDREKKTISGRGAVDITFPLPYSANTCGDGNQTGFSVTNKRWINRYSDDINDDNKKDSKIVYKLIINELLKIDSDTLNYIDKKNYCSIIELLLRKKQNNKNIDENIEYHLGYDKILLPLNNNPETNNYTWKNIKIDSIIEKIYKEENNFKYKKGKELIDIEILSSGYEKEKIEYGYERLNFTEKVKIINHIINKKYNKKEKLNDTEKNIIDYVKENFIYKESGEYIINKNIDKKPIGFYLFN